jgi:hypothetical protein
LAKHHKVVSQSLINQGKGSCFTYPCVQILDHDDGEEESSLRIF